MEVDGFVHLGLSENAVASKLIRAMKYWAED